MIKNIFIVEGTRDVYFITSVLKFLEEKNKSIFFSLLEDSFQTTSKNDKGEKIAEKIEMALTQNLPIINIGIILDADGEDSEDVSIVKTKNLEIIKKAINIVLYKYKHLKSIDNLELKDENVFYKFLNTENDYEISIGFHFTNVDGKGELETLLKSIKSKDSPFADCILESWVNCIQTKGKKISKKGEQGDIIDKEINPKLWVEFYHRFDTMTKKERSKSEINTNWESIFTGEFTDNKDKSKKQISRKLAKDIYNYEDEKLDNLKKFLNLFAENR